LVHVNNSFTVVQQAILTALADEPIAKQKVIAAIAGDEPGKGKPAAVALRRASWDNSWSVTVRAAERCRQRSQRLVTGTAPNSVWSATNYSPTMSG
jgi:hypothetical protein